MPTYETMNRRTKDLHFSGLDYNGRPVIINAAEILPGHFEVMAMRPDGDELESVNAASLEEARREYARMVTYHTTGAAAGMYTRENWTQDRVFSAAPGQEISPDVYNDMLDCLPSLSLPRSYCRQYCGGFLMGEPHSFDASTGKQTFAAFGKNNGHYYFIGYIPA